MRYFHFHEDDELAEEQLARWVKQVAELEGEGCFWIFGVDLCGP